MEATCILNIKPTLCRQKELDYIVVNVMLFFCVYMFVFNQC